MNVRDIMTKNVVYTNPSSTIIEVARLMQKHNIGSIPVCDQKRLVGILTDRDIVVRNIAHGNDPNTTKTQHVMTSDVLVVTPDTDVRELAKLMSEHQVRRIPVVENINGNNNTLIGMVALGDIATDGKDNMEASNALSDVSTPSKPENI